MFLADMMIYTVDAAFKDGEVAFNRVCMNVSANVFADAVVDGTVKDEFTPDFLRCATFICHDKRGSVDLCRDNWAQCGGIDRRDMMRFDATAALDQGKHSFLASAAGSDVLALVAVLILMLIRMSDMRQGTLLFHLQLRGGNKCQCFEILSARSAFDGLLL